jgi:hypothetical protein
MGAQQVLVPIVVAVAIVGAYHVLVAPRAGPASREVAALADDVKALRKEAADARAAVAALSARGTAPAGTTTPPSAGHTVASAPRPPAPGSPEAEDLAAFRAKLEEVERIRQAERESDGWRRRVAATGVSLTPAQATDVVALGMGYQESVRALLPKGSVAATAEEREAAHRKMEELRAGVQVRLLQIVPEKAVEKLMPLFPGPPKARGERLLTAPGASDKLR